MIKKLAATIGISSLILLSAGKAHCTTLPESVESYIKQNSPNAGIRFDGLVELPDGTRYLPVFPLAYQENSKTAEVVKTLPENSSFADKPNMILFSNNLTLLKIIEKEDGTLTITDSDDMPLKVKLGILPQDLIVPEGLIIPTELRVILGNLKIPVKQKTDKEDEIAFYDKAKSNSVPVSFVKGNVKEVHGPAELRFLQNKKIYSANFKKNIINVINPETGRVENYIKIPSNPASIALTKDKRYILASGLASNNIYVVDTLNQQFAKSIEVGKYPTDIVINKDTNKAYVANRFSSNITEIDLINMVPEKNIIVSGLPSKLVIGDNKNTLYYTDTLTDTIYRVLVDGCVSSKVVSGKNISKIQQFGKHLFFTSRSEGTLTVFNLKSNEIEKVIKVGQKPIDFKVFGTKGEIIVLNAESDDISVINMTNFDVEKTISLNSGGFPGSINVLNSENRALITNLDSYEIIIYDVDLRKVISQMPVETNIGFIQVIE